MKESEMSKGGQYDRTQNFGGECDTLYRDAELYCCTPEPYVML